MSQKIAPQPNPISQHYFQCAKEGKLCLQQCLTCHRHQFYSRSLCSHCGEQALQWAREPGLGRTATFTIVRRGISAAYSTPYVVALVDLDEGPRMMTQIYTEDETLLVIGLPVHVAFEPWSDNYLLPVFKPVHEFGES